VLPDKVCAALIPCDGLVGIQAVGDVMVLQEILSGPKSPVCLPLCPP